MEKFVVDKTKPIIPQIEELFPDNNPIFIGFELLTEDEDILKFFSELTEIRRKEEPDHPDPRESVRSDFAYITGYSDSWDSQWKKFREVLGSQFDEARKNCELAKKNKKRE